MSVGCWGDSSVTFGVVESDGNWIGIESNFCVVQNSGATDSHFGGATVAHTQGSPIDSIGDLG